MLHFFLLLLAQNVSQLLSVKEEDNKKIPVALNVMNMKFLNIY